MVLGIQLFHPVDTNVPDEQRRALKVPCLDGDNRGLRAKSLDEMRRSEIVRQTIETIAVATDVPDSYDRKIEE